MAARKMLTLKPDERLPALALLDQLAGLDNVWKDDLGGFLNLSAINALLYRNLSPGAVPDAQGRMWQLALHLEEGATEQTARALAQAREALREALDAQQRGDKIDPAEIDRRMQDLQEALDRHLQALAEQARRDPSSEQFDPNSQPLDARNMERKAEQMRNAARQGKMDAARQNLAELDKMLEELENARPEHGQMTEAERKRAEKRQRGQQQMSVLQDIVRRQGSLLDHSQSRADDSGTRQRLGQFDQPQSSNDRSSADQSSTDQQQDNAERKADRTVQQALRLALGELMQQYGDLTGKVPPNLGDADSAMRDSAQALAAGQDGNAEDAQQRAIEALQKGGQGMSQQMARQFGRGQQSGDDGQGDQEADQEGDGEGQGQMTGTEPGNDQYGNAPGSQQRGGSRSMARQGDDRRDPLGRRLRPGTSGADDDGDVTVPDQMEAARTRAIQEELRRRGADRTRPQPELDYIGRLLQQF
jgi:hypothetical protein